MIWLMFIFTSKYSLNSICQSNKKNQSFYKPLTLIIIVLFSQLQDMFKNISSFIKKPSIEKRKRSGLCDFLMTTGTTPLKGYITVT